MSTKIAILPENVANKIAAGEVVERPASVVKELVENSLDASAATVSVEVRAGGRRLIRVEDDGCGMSRQDSILAFERFGTSKIRTAADLERITTLGFRGEALASIASVSYVKLTTRPQDSDYGTQVVVAGGKLKRVEEVGCPKGTVVEVSRLFYNTPARRAFMASTETETFWITQVVSDYALCRPDVRFLLTHNGKRVFDAPVTEGFEQRIAAVMGPDLLRQMVDVSARDGEMVLEGYIGLPTKATAGGQRLQSLFVNRRAVRSKKVMQSVYAAYKPYLMRGRHPALVLFIDVDPARVNVNVHPTKKEVRFADEARVCDFVRSAVSRRLAEVMTGPVTEVTRMMRSGLYAPSKAKEASGPGGADLPGRRVGRKVAQRRANPRSSGLPARVAAAGPGSSEAAGANGLEPAEAAAKRPKQSAGNVPSQVSLFAEELIPIGQIDNSFIVAQSPGLLVIIDQHAAHERILYERFLRQIQLGSLPSQRLLIPAVVELSPSMHGLLLSKASLLGQMGFVIEDFGGVSIAVKSKPVPLSDEQVEEIICEIGERLAEVFSVSADGFEPLEEICALLACKAAVKAGQRLCKDEMKELLDELGRAEKPNVCPHGRPTTVELTIDQLRKSFGRTAKKKAR